MIYQKSKIKRNLVLVIIFVSIGLLFVTVWNSCPVRTLSILNDIERYHETLDPDFCESIVYRIDVFNDDCEPEIEIIDCG